MWWLLWACGTSTPPAPEAPQAASPTATEAPASDVVRLAEGRVTERWGGGDGLTVTAASTAQWQVPAGSLRASLYAEEATELVVRLDGEPVQTVAVSFHTPLALDLPRAGTLSLTTEGTVAVLDPTVVPAGREDGRRVVMVFLDTTRADHLQVYGYERETTPNLLARSGDCAVFDQARSVAPWTLPSVRAAFSGRQPEHWPEATPIAERLAAEGWATRAVFTNAYLTPTFQMDRGWQSYHYQLKRSAIAVTNTGLSWLDELEGRDGLLLLQFMDMHLPYKEPDAWQGRWADRDFDAPELMVGTLRRTKRSKPLEDYVVGRYDQNLRYVDAQLGRLFEALDDDDVVVVFADHGEEFWDHGGFEHGHAFWDEVLRVPLMLCGPGIPAGRYDTPASLLDLTPTVLDLLGLDPGEVDGRSLLPATRGESVDARTLVFGRPLYGLDGWGVLHEGRKWWGRAGEQALYDLAADPGETQALPVGQHAATRGAFGDAWPGGIHRGWLFTLNSGRVTSDLTVEISHPGGLERAWAAYAPKAKGPVPAPTVADGVLTYTQNPEDGSAGSLFVIPAGAPSDLVGLHVTMRLGDKVVDQTWTEPIPEAAFEGRNTLFTMGPKGFKVLVRAAWEAEPLGTAVQAFDPGMANELRALGYVE
jgi:hypothetical protein